MNNYFDAWEKLETDNPMILVIGSVSHFRILDEAGEKRIHHHE